MTESMLLRELAERYRRDGYEVVLEPGPGDMPFDLGGYRPDLLVRKEHTGYLIEVKTRADDISVDQLRSVAEKVKDHRGWRFLLASAQDVVKEGLPGEDEESITWDGIAEQVDHALRLKDAGEEMAAYLILWIALERLLRVQARHVSLPVDRLAPSILIRQLYSQGELTMSQFDTALQCLETRNRAVHGFNTPDLADSIDRLSALVRQLWEEWSASSAAT
ncbi:MAG: hypothetical protein ACLP7Q_21305 [Isosphaeraceae bacterium]